MKDYKPCPLAAGLAFGIFWAIAVALMWIAGNFRGQYEFFVLTIWEFYIGYSITLGGILLWMLWAFIDAFLGALILVWLYNVIYRRIKK